MDAKGKALSETSGGGTFRPNREQLQQAMGKSIPDLIAPGLHVLFCGINPGLYTAAVGRHFARPGNRFWPALYAAGFTERLLSPFEELELLKNGYGITNLVARATAGAAEVSREELEQGAMMLREKLRFYQPGFLAILGLGAYRNAFKHPKATIGPQAEAIEGCAVWVLPSPSGANAWYQPVVLVECLTQLRQAVLATEVQRTQRP